MIIFAHRGYWLEKSEQNSFQALQLAFEKGYSIETDIWRVGDDLIISHDNPIVNSSLLTVNMFLDRVELYTNEVINIAWNIKTDSCEQLIVKFLENFKGLKINHFFFDMSIPAMIAMHKFSKQIPLCTRLSDVEVVPVLYEESNYIWLDSFNQEWLKPEVLLRHHKKGKFLIVVSSELHKRDKSQLWDMLHTYYMSYPDYRHLMAICTDYPDQARTFFV
ncbi:hypothetical protein [Cohnella massiliensis]|uniref:hypothetical protein n=1 Tax=Cohnella massiliensis TaxID=1816691 RepID=UPI0009BA797F|nr:hypothetical protein [Cohnella massiliensis]